jgi:hypothetical protein
MEQPSEPVSNDSGSARLRVLEMIDEGSITAEEGLRLLQAFSAADVAAEAGDPVDFVAESAVLPLNDAQVLRQAEVPREAEIPLPNGAATSLQPASIERVGITASQPVPSGESTVAEQPAHAKQPADAEQPAHAKQPADAEQPAHAEPPAAAVTSPTGLPADALKWKRWWMVPVWIGVAITVFGGLFMYLAMESSGLGFWFVCASVPFTLGLLVIVLAWGSRNAPWLHLRVQQPPGERPEKIAFSLPLPVRPAVWFLRTFSRWIPDLKEQAWDEVILAIGDKTSPDNPLYIIVDEEETGEKVEIYIG